MKKFGTILLSVLLVLCMAMGATACDNDSGNGGGGNEPPNPPAATPALELNVESITLVKGQSVKVTATVTNTDKKATFKLTGENASAVAKVDPAEANVATVTALGEGTATLLVELEGATSVSVPVTVSEPQTPPPAETPALAVDVSNITLMKGQSVKVTATVTNTDKKATFKLTGENASEVAKVETAEDNAATVTALGDGEATLVIELEGATSVSVPVTVNGMLNLTGIITELTGEYDLNASDDSNKSGTFGVEHYLGDDYKVEVLYENSSVAEFTEQNGTYTVTAKQAGIANVTIVLSKLKENEENPYDVISSNTVSIVCTDETNERAKEEASAKLLAFKEVSGGYAAYITDKEDAEGASLGAEQSNGVLRIPAIHNRKPVTALTNCQDKVLTDKQATFLYLETAEGNDNAGEEIINAYSDIYAAVKEVYLPCTIKTIPFRAFRSPNLEKVEIQEGSHITAIKSRAFEMTAKLSSLNLEVCRELKTIGDNAFENGGSETLSVTVPNSVTSIAVRAFALSKMAKLSFEPAKIVDGAYVPSIVVNNSAGLGQETFSGAQIGTVELRNIKEFTGLDIIFNTASTKMLLIGEDMVAAITDGTTIFAFAFTAANKTELILEGVNNAIPVNVDTTQKIPAPHLIDTYGALFGTNARFRNEIYKAPYAIYVHKDVNPNDNWFKLFFREDSEFTGEGNMTDYKKWVVLDALKDLMN